MNKYLFLHVSKCGGTSIKKAIKDVPNVYNFDRYDLDCLHLKIKKEMSNTTKFTIVRNPYSRLASAINMFRRKGYDISVHEVLDIVENEDVSHLFQFFSKKESYVKRHCLPMCDRHYCLIDDGEMIVDKIYYFENFSKTISEIQDLLKTELKVRHLNASKNKLIDFSKDEIARINKIYQKDFEIFKYKIRR
jgi:hypothetical protein